MSRELSITLWRPLAVWSAVTVAAVLAAASTPGLWRAADHVVGADGVADLIVAGCATVLSLALAWLWVVTTVTVGGLLTGRTRACGGAAKRLVLVACGAAVVAGTALPAVAAGGEGRALLVGLPLPERAAAPAVHHRPRLPATTPVATPGPRGTYVVRPGDSLWSIARAHLDASGSVERCWRAIWAANRDVVGDDPDLILPGQVLRLPGTHHDRPEQDGD